MDINLIKRADGLLEAADSEAMAILESIECGKQLSLTRNEDKHTDKQRSALHVYCRNLAIELNNMGLTQMKVLKHDAEIDWTESSVKENLWRPMQIAITSTKSTEDAKRSDHGEVYRHLSRHLAAKFGVSLSWPNRHGD